MNFLLSLLNPKTTTISTQTHHETCGICLEPLIEKLQSCITDCDHYFHQKCLWTWEESDNANCDLCPLCRAIMPHLFNDNESDYSDIEDGTGGGEVDTRPNQGFLSHNVFTRSNKAIDNHLRRMRIGREKRAYKAMERMFEYEPTTF